MLGRREIVGEVKGVMGEVQAVREVLTDFKSAIFETIEKEWDKYREEQNMRDKVMERRLSKLIESVSKPDNVVKAIEVRESDKVREKEREEIIDMHSRIYAQENSTDIFLIGERGGIQWTEEGRELYDLFSKAVIKIAGYNGSKAHSKVANRTTYNEFAEQENLEEQLEKKELGGRMSVYVDLFERGLVGKFTKFLEERFLNESEAM